MRLVLASSSPRRRALLAAVGIRVEIDPVDVDESPENREAPDVYVERLARAKATAGAGRHPDALVIAADTTVVLSGEILGKPETDAQASNMLRQLAGREHQVLTGVAVAHGGRLVSHVERTRVTLGPMSEAEIAAYVATGEPRDKAGAYAVQGGAARFVSAIEGSYTNVVGLPVAAVLQLAGRLGLADALGLAAVRPGRSASG